jgi:hypothetical protein
MCTSFTKEQRAWTCEVGSAQRLKVLTSWGALMQCEDADAEEDEAPADLSLVNPPAPALPQSGANK